MNRRHTGKTGRNLTPKPPDVTAEDWLNHLDDLTSKPSELTVGAWIRYLREERRGWSLNDLARAMVRIGACYDGSATVKSLKSMISKWEHGHIEPDEYNAHLLATTLGVNVADLGLWADPRFVWKPKRPAALTTVLRALSLPAPGGSDQRGPVAALTRTTTLTTPTTR